MREQQKFIKMKDSRHFFLKKNRIIFNISKLRFKYIFIS